jgi:hypothetical protein
MYSNWYVLYVSVDWMLAGSGWNYIYFVSQPLHVLGMFISHHQDVLTVYLQQLVRVIRLS